LVRQLPLPNSIANSVSPLTPSLRPSKHASKPTVFFSLQKHYSGDGYGNISIAVSCFCVT
jgi:hypothetical protein